MPQKISAQYKIDNSIKANNILQYNGKDFIPTNKTIQIESVVDYYTGELYEMSFMIMDGTSGQGYAFQKGSYWGISSLGNEIQTLITLACMFTMRKKVYVLWQTWRD